MMHINNLFCSENIVFILVGNEEIDRSYFLGYNCHFSTSNAIAEDLYLLSQSDYILGPPSTFSAWASLYNNTPLYFIENVEYNFEIKDFVDIKNFWF